MYKQKLKIYLDDLAAKLPAPGGGSAAALTAASAVALISMVANFTLGKEKYKSVEKEIKEVLDSAEALREKLSSLVDEDVVAYGKVSEAYALPKENPEQKSKRQQAIQQGLKQALATPLEVCRACAEAARLCPVTAESGNRNLVSDVGVAILFIEAAYQAALLNVEINLNGIKDEKFISEIRQTLDPLEKELMLIKNKVQQAVKAKMAQGAN
ncbi:MAG: cyclodeaminase/cyclohydrolase family protein [Candidatus Omnitrophica bacterium]|nr:cyclodeaminase/cyclohydrolase family protein [Candidatus Omnitrophota bacterium]